MEAGADVTWGRQTVQPIRLLSVACRRINGNGIITKHPNHTKIICCYVWNNPADVPSVVHCTITVNAEGSQEIVRMSCAPSGRANS